MRIIYCIIFFVFASTRISCGQQTLLEHTAALELVKDGLFHIYNAQPQEADTYIDRVEKLLPSHPVGPMLRALNTNWSSNPIESDSEEFLRLNGYLQLALDRNKNLFELEAGELEAIFFAMAINSWLAQFYDEDGNTLKALAAAKRAYHYMKQGFRLLEYSPEFYFSTGLYNYYRVQYPESNPIYKPFMWFFRNGDKALGLKQLERASREATFTRAEAAMYLAHLNLRYEQNPQEAVRYSRQLVEQYPNNVFFKINYTEALLSASNYSHAYPIIQRLVLEDKSYYRMAGEIFYGIYLEKKLDDFERARIWYEKSLQTGRHLGRRADNKKSLAHAGLARLANAEGKTSEASEHYRRALKLAQYDAVRREAKAYLRQN